MIIQIVDSPVTTHLSIHNLQQIQEFLPLPYISENGPPKMQL